MIEFLLGLLAVYFVLQVLLGVIVYIDITVHGYKEHFRGLTILDLVISFPAIIFGSLFAIKLFKDKE